MKHLLLTLSLLLLSSPVIGDWIFIKSIDEMTNENFASERYDSTLLEPTRNRLEPWQPVDKAEFAESEPRPDFSDWVALTGFKDYIPDIHQVI